MTTYLTDSEGKFIPATQRPDGTWRKARRVKDGYVPQEEVPLYESKGKQYALRKTGLPPGVCPFVVEAAKKEREKEERAKAKKLEREAAAAAAVATATASTSTAANATAVSKSKKKSSSKQNQKLTAIIATTTASADAVESLSEHLATAVKLQNEASEADEMPRKIKKLRKKLREIEAIETKIKSGELKKPDKDQMEKVKRKAEFNRELTYLESVQAMQRIGSE